MRLFIAQLFTIDLQQDLQDQLVALRRSDSASQVRWVHRDALHLTLRFIGEEAENRIEAWVQQLDRALVGLEAPILAAGPCGAFPNLRRARILWVGLREHGKRLGTLHDHIQAAAEQMGLERERRVFQPHVTLGRLRTARNKPPQPLGEALLKKLSQLAPPPRRPEPQSSIALVQSHLSPKGATYESLRTWNLAAIDRR